MPLEEIRCCSRGLIRVCEASESEELERTR